MLAPAKRRQRSRDRAIVFSGLMESSLFSQSYAGSGSRAEDHCGRRRSEFLSGSPNASSSDTAHPSKTMPSRNCKAPFGHWRDEFPEPFRCRINARSAPETVLFGTTLQRDSGIRGKRHSAMKRLFLLGLMFLLATLPAAAVNGRAVILATTTS